jgi:hypothetical protein
MRFVEMLHHLFNRQQKVPANPKTAGSNNIESRNATWSSGSYPTHDPIVKFVAERDQPVSWICYGEQRTENPNYFCARGGA